MQLPNCFYCGKFVNPDKPEIETKEVYDYFGPDFRFYHKACKEPGEAKRKLLIDKLNSYGTAKH